MLADRISVGTTFTRGDYNRGWNQVLLLASDVAALESSDAASSTAGGATTMMTATTMAMRYPPLPYIIDLMHYPGRLMPADSSEASAYMKI